MTKYYVEYKGGSKEVYGLAKAKKLADKMAGRVRTMVLDGYRVVYPPTAVK